jgi:serine/threonine protein phosphatase PrpC
MIKRTNRDRDIGETQKCCEVMIDKALAKDISEDNAAGTDNMTCVLVEFLR